MAPAGAPELREQLGLAKDASDQDVAEAVASLRAKAEIAEADVDRLVEQRIAERDAIQAAVAPKGVMVTIIGVGAFVKRLGSDARRPYTRGEEILVSENLAEQMVADGVAILSSPGKALADMTVPELKQVAATRGVELGEAKSKQQILAVLEAAESSQ